MNASCLMEACASLSGVTHKIHLRFLHTYKAFKYIDYDSNWTQDEMTQLWIYVTWRSIKCHSKWNPVALHLKTTIFFTKWHWMFFICIWHCISLDFFENGSHAVFNITLLFIFLGPFCHLICLCASLSLYVCTIMIFSEVPLTHLKFILFPFHSNKLPWMQNYILKGNRQNSVATTISLLLLWKGI